MQTYSCKVRLAGSVTNEVRKSGVTAADVVVLRLIHGQTAVLEIRPDGDVKLTQEELRDRLMRDYVTHSPEVGKLLNQAFPGFLHAAVELPTKLSSVELAEEEVRRPRVAHRNDGTEAAA